MKDITEVTNTATKEKISTSPWKQRNNRWVPDITRLPKEHVGFRPYFANRAKVEKRLQMGWVIAKPSDYGLDIKGNQYITGDLILMELPEEYAKDREAYYEHLAESNISAGRMQACEKVTEVSQEGGGDKVAIYRDELETKKS
jgi:type 1 glutamine amidotransferase